MVEIDLSLFQDECCQGGGSDRLAKIQQATNIVRALLTFRPDLSYVKNISYLVSTFLVYCDEPDTFTAVANLIHSHYFLNMIRGYVSDVKLRIYLFEELFKKNLPDLYEHFAFLEIETAFYLPDWMLSCMVRVLNFKTASRVMDCFLLDGEAFIIKTGIALLMCYESALLKSSHFEIKDRLRNCRDVDEDKLFAVIFDQV